MPPALEAGACVIRGIDSATERLAVGVSVCRICKSKLEVGVEGVVVIVSVAKTFWSESRVMTRPNTCTARRAHGQMAAFTRSILRRPVLGQGEWFRPIRSGRSKLGI